MSIESPLFLAAVLLLTTLVVWLVREYATGSRLTRCLLFAGVILLGVSTAGLRVRWPAGKEIVVMVDLSPSTRGATYRDAVTLRERIGQLVGRNRHRIVYFPDRPGGLPVQNTKGLLADVPADYTRFEPPSADAVVLFSDGQFEPGRTDAPIFPVIDTALENPTDVAVTELEARGPETNRVLNATVRASGPASSLLFSGTADRNPIPLSAGRYRIDSRPVSAPAASARIRFDDGGFDLWPENDALALHVAPPANTQRWWIGRGAPAGWLPVDPSSLPIDAAAYLPTGIVALNNIPADALTADRRQRLAQYVKDLGGALLVVGGDRSFAAGGYSGTELDALSPLASDPPTPEGRWVVLVDASGSMAAASGTGADVTRWAVAAKAAAGLLAVLPPTDRIDIGSFAGEVRWWSAGKSVAETSKLPLPPAGITPTGPTNLQAALDSLTRAESSLPTHLVLITDADTTLDDVATLSERLKSARITPHLLATAAIAADNPVRKLVAFCGGQSASEPNALQWADVVKRLLRPVVPGRLGEGTATARFESVAGLNDRSIASWNHTWQRESATPLANVERGDTREPGVAEWSYGAGRVVASAFGLQGNEVEALTGRIAARPRDPRLSVDWKMDAKLSVTLNAVDGKEYLNDLQPALELSGDEPTTATTRPLRQTAPGRYEAQTPAPPTPMIGTVRLAGQIVDRRGIAGRYAEEFEQIGNDRLRLNDLAIRTGGRLIEPDQTGPIDFPWPARYVPLASVLAMLGGVLIVCGAVAWKLSM